MKEELSNSEQCVQEVINSLGEIIKTIKGTRETFKEIHVIMKRRKAYEKKRAKIYFLMLVSYLYILILVIIETFT